MSFKKCKDLILGIVMLALSGFYLFYAKQIKTRPKLTPSYASAQVIPTLLGILLAVLSAVLIYQGIRKLKEPDGADQTAKGSREDLISVVLTLAIILLYVAILDTAGFILATIIYLFCHSATFE